MGEVVVGAGMEVYLELCTFNVCVVVFHFQSRIMYMIAIQRFTLDVLYFLVQGFIYCILHVRS